MKRIFSLILLPTCHLLSCTTLLFAQTADADWNRATRYWNHQKYNAAQHLYDTWLAQNPNSSSSDLALARYRSTACAIELQHQDAVKRVRAFESAFPEHPLVRQARWDFANYLYRKREWKDAAMAFDSLNALRMGPAQKIEMQFKRGHALFELEQYEDARLDLFSVMEAGEDAGAFENPARYYFSHISYLKGQSQVALEGFESLKNDPKLRRVIPIYVAQLLHETQQYERLIDYAPEVFTPDVDLNVSQHTDISRLVGDALYREQRFNEALPHLEKAYHAARGEGRTRDFAYQMGYTYYQADEYLKALTCFALVVRESDEIAQLAHYHTAACYLNLGKKEKAKLAFKKAAESDYDGGIQEDALFSYAKLAYELTWNPFDDAVIAIERYLTKYPKSHRKDEAYGFLLEVYTSSRDYDRALAALDQIEIKTPDVKKAYQLVAFNRGVELFRAASYAECNAFFDAARTYPIDATIAAESYFWQGEAHYLQGNYPSATSAYATFESAPGAFQSKHYADGMYARGYALFQRKLYLDASSAFRSYLKTTAKSTFPKRTDAKLRVADCYYANKEFEPAARYYGEVIAESQKAEAYARFQRAECFSSLNQPEAQIAELNALVASGIQSTYLPEALYALGRAEIETNDIESAKAHLLELRSTYPESLKSKNALVDLCLIAMKQNQPTEVLVLWDEIRARYGSDAIASDAYNVVEPVLIDLGLLNDLPAGVGLNTDEIEARLFNAARDAALERDCEKAIRRLTEYIENYVSGTFHTEAHFFLANCAYDIGDLNKARTAFETVLQAPINDYTEPAALGAATIAWNAQDLVGAKQHYATLEAACVLQENVLEARIGLMRCHYLLGETEQALAYANVVIEDNQTPEDIAATARYWRGKINFVAKAYEQASLDLEKVAALGGERGAESQFLLCRMSYESGDYPATEQALFEFIEAYANYDAWKHKAFLLLVDTYVGRSDWFQARATVESILEYVKIEEIRSKASQKLAIIDELELAELNPPISNDSIITNSSIPQQNVP